MTEPRTLIPLTQGFSAIVDPEDFDALIKYRWKILKVRTNRYAARTVMLSGRRCGTVLMHRVITDAAEGVEVDHENGDGLDNRRFNLRPCSPTQNRANIRLISGSSRFKGVYWNREKRKWQSQIGSGLNGTGKKTIYLGRFDSEQEAADAYDRKAVELWGEFAATNAILKPPGWTPPDVAAVLADQPPIPEVGDTAKGVGA